MPVSTGAGWRRRHAQGHPAGGRGQRIKVACHRADRAGRHPGEAAAV